MNFKLRDRRIYQNKTNTVAADGRSYQFKARLTTVRRAIGREFFKVLQAFNVSLVT